MGICIPIKFKDTFKMELEKDMKNMAELFRLDLTIRENSIESVVMSVNWTHQEYYIVNKIYGKDLKYFYYQ